MLKSNSAQPSAILVTDTSGPTKNMLSYFTILINTLKAFVIYLFNLPLSIPFFNPEKLWVWDLRTFRWYSIPITHGAVDAMEFRRISPLSPTASTEEHMAKGLTVCISPLQD
jgi:hypothetical protein